eukprot:Pompholyxophrys_punicea_v1_NODE_491_length_1850_cov_25.837326.p3 type:complete len:103 gc:universal NODE_491_length_1850_cov_25.837326:1233-1541(+)
MPLFCSGMGTSLPGYPMFLFRRLILHRDCQSRRKDQILVSYKHFLEDCILPSKSSSFSASEQFNLISGSTSALAGMCKSFKGVRSIQSLNRSKRSEYNFFFS